MGTAATRAKIKWDKKNRLAVNVKLDKKLVEEFNQVLRITGDTKASVIRDAIKEYIRNNKEC